MKRILFFFSLVMVMQTGISQVVIRPSQYKIKFEASFPSGAGYNQYDNGTQAFLLDATSNNILGQAYSVENTITDSMNSIEATSQPQYIRFIHKIVVNQEDCYYDQYRDIDECYYYQEFYDDHTETIALSYPYFETTQTTSYGAIFKVKVEPILDISYNLPSHERTSLVASGGTISNAIWQYQVEDGAWTTIPSSLYNIGGLNISGMDLFGGDYLNYINKTIRLKVKYNNGYGEQESMMAAFTHRLSAPHIVSITPTNVSCFGGFSGKIAIQFDRPLYDGERLNLFLTDTVSNSYFSKLNISALEPGNRITWESELPKGVYFFSMIGKYDQGLPFDQGYAYRDPSVNAYKARRSITFYPGFESSTSDNFEASIDTTVISSATYTGSNQHYGFVSISQPSRVVFTINKQNDVRCKGGNDGALNIYAKGGVGNYSYVLKKSGSPDIVGSFTSNTPNPNNQHYVLHTVTGLPAGSYNIGVRDGNGCMLKDSVGNEITRPLIINEPPVGVHQDLLEISPITSSDSTNGKIKVNITGGTPFANGEVKRNKYTFEWRDSATNTVQTNYEIDSVGHKFTITLKGLKEGTYILRAYDANGSSFSSTGGCNLLLKVTIRKPQPLLVSILQQESIQCYGAGNGILKAMPGGGHAIDSLRYKFKWYLENSSTPTLLSSTDSLLKNAIPGNYFVEIEDRFGNKKRSASFTLSQPTNLQLTKSVTPATCYSTANGSISVTASGGTPPYKYEWSTGHKGNIVNNLPGGTYLVVVTDSLGCDIVEQVSITSPIQVKAVPAVTPVSCLGKADGRISLAVSGGAGSYTYLWSTGATGSMITGLVPGRYWYKVSDANGCFATDTIELDTPELLTATLDADRNICLGQTVSLTATINSTAPLQYNWTSTNGFSATTPSIQITQGGTYVVAVSNVRNCIVKDTIVLTPVNSTIHSDYIVSTQVYKNENVLLINMSNPVPDSIQWMTPVMNGIDVLQKNRNYCELRFADTGRYEVSMKAFYSSGCIDLVRKPIIVVNKEAFNGLGNQAQAYLKKFGVYPNPNTGQFNVELLFNSPTKARLRFVNTLTNVTVDDRTVEGTASYMLSYNYGGALVAGTYILIIETAKGNFVHKVVIQ